ncbi:g372 [Coccomyxa elongata]
MASDHRLADAPAAIGAFQCPALIGSDRAAHPPVEVQPREARLLQEACADLPLETGGCGRYRGAAPRAAAGAQPVPQGQPPAPASVGLPCLASRAGQCVRYRSRRQLFRWRIACATGAAAGACYRRPTLPCHSRPAGAAATGPPHRELPPARSLCYRGRPPAPATGGLPCLASRAGRCVRYRSRRQLFRWRVACATGAAAGA